MYSGGELGIRMYSEGELSIRTYLSGSLVCTSILSGHPPHLKTWSSFSSFGISSFRINGVFVLLRFATDR